MRRPREPRRPRPRRACDAPVVIWVHGGGYQIGDEKNQMADEVRLFAEGWILVSHVNYRLTTPGKPGSATFPTAPTRTSPPPWLVHAQIPRYGGDPNAPPCSATRRAPTSSAT
ncbi:MAG: carboxylesterase family protein [Acidimicrobiales bacterium]